MTIQQRLLIVMATHTTLSEEPLGKEEEQEEDRDTNH